MTQNKLKRPTKNILSNICITQALNKNFAKLSNFKPQYPTVAEIENQYNDQSSTASISNIFSHRPLA
jgi:hypothetical protein